jgi:hypothetical protein
MTDLRILAQPDSVHSVEDALAHISLPQPVPVGRLSSGEMNQELQIEALPSVLVLHFNRFLYDAAADGTAKISKPVQFAPELEVPLGKIFSFVSLVLAKAKNSSWLDLPRYYGPRYR